jgi:hypothetical protein
MGKTYEEITPELSEWISEQKLFFVATAPLAQSGLVNCSPKGMDTFRLIGPREVAYLDFTGSGIETIAHLRENGRIVVMLCALAGPPKIVRLYGIGRAVVPETPEWDELRPQFPADAPGARAIVQISLTRISDSCGFAVPRFDYVEERDVLTRWAQSKTDAELADYRAQKNTESLDGLPGLTPK